MRQVSRIGSLCLLLLLLSWSGTFGWTVPVDITNGPDYEVGEQLAVDSSDNIHMVWYGDGSEASSWNICYQMYNGSSWSSKVVISGDYAMHPDVAVDGNGDIHVVWDQGGNPSDVYYRKKSGGSWGSIVNLSNSASRRSLCPRLAVDSSGNNILVAWHEDKQVGDNWDILACKCTSGSWGNLENVSGDSTLSRTADVGVDSSSNFHVAWEDTDTRHAYYRKRNSNNTWNGRVTLDTTSGRSYTPHIAVSSNDYVHIAWHDDNDDWDIAYRYYNGSSWSSVTNVSNNPGVVDCYAGITTDSNDDVHIVWKDYHDIYYAHTVDGTWADWYKLSEGDNQGDPEPIVLSNDELHVVYPSRDPGTWDLMWMFTTVPDTTAPDQVTDVTAEGTDQQVELHWVNPDNVDYTGTIIRWSTSGYPSGPNDGSLLIDDSADPGSWESHIHTSLTNETTYYYSFFTYDAEPNYSSAFQVAATPTSGPKENLLENPYIDGFSSGVASNWTSYRVNDSSTATTFAEDDSNYKTDPSQNITGIDSGSLPGTGLSAAGVYQAVSGLTTGKVYQFVGYQDIYTSDFGADGHRYILNFGINTSGGTTPGSASTDGTIGGCSWMTSDQAFWNDTGGSPVYFGGFHRSTAAFVAESDSVSVWSGVTIDNTGTKDNVSAKFNTDQHYLFEWDFPANTSLVNGNFEGNLIDLDDGGDVIPEGWIPAGGGVGEWNAWNCDEYGKRSGDYGVKMGNRRGTIYGGLMQKIATTVDSYHEFSAYVKASGQDSTVAAIGIDPTGGGDITSANINWQTTTSDTWTQKTVNDTAEATEITLFLRVSNTNSAGWNYHTACFDDCTHSEQGAPQDGSISGYVYDGDSNVVANATVQTDTGGYSDTTDANGYYELTEVDPDTYTVTASKTGYESHVKENVVVASGDDVTENFTILEEVGEISGYVLDNNGNAVEGATVQTDTGGDQTSSAADGSYTLEDVDPGTYDVTASKSGYVSDTEEDVTVVEFETTTADFELSPTPGSISGTVTDQCEDPVSGATVETDTGGYNTTTAQDGTYTLSSVAPGTYDVTVSKDDYVSTTETDVTVTAGQNTNQNFTLYESGGTEEVLDNGDMEGGFWSTGWGGGSAIPNDWDGWYQPGSDFNCYDETTVVHGDSHSAETTISSGGDSGSGGYKRGIYQNVNVGANTDFTITVWARHTNGNCPSIMCWNYGQNESDPNDAYGTDRYQWVTTDNWGQLNTWVSRSMEGTADSGGWITVIVGGAHHGGGVGYVYIDDVSVEAEAAAAATGNISGYVLDTSNDPISGATVSTDTGGYQTTSAGDGSYTLSDVETGTYDVTASASGYVSDTDTDVQVTACQTTTDVDFNLEDQSEPVEKLDNGDMEGGFWDTGWGGGSAIPDDWDGWYQPGTDFNCFDETSVKHGDSHSAKTTISSGGDSGSGGYKRGIYQNVYVGSNADFTFTVWAYHTNGNCPSIMCWNSGQDENDPEDAYGTGRYQWVTTDNWEELDTWVSNEMEGTADSGGWITVIVGGAHHGGGGAAIVYIDDVSVTVP